MSLLSTTDTIYALRFLKLLTMEWEDTEAYKLGIIDDKGEVINKPKTTKEKEAYNIFHKLVFNIKRLLPQSKVATYGSALFLLKEHTKLKSEDLLLMIESIGYSTSITLKEGLMTYESNLMPGKYYLKENIASPKTGDFIAKSGTSINILNKTEPVDAISGLNIYKVLHNDTNQEIYISIEDIE